MVGRCHGKVWVEAMVLGIPGGGLYCSWESMTSSFLAPGAPCSIVGGGEESGKE